MILLADHAGLLPRAGTDTDPAGAGAVVTECRVACTRPPVEADLKL